MNKIKNLYRIFEECTTICTDTRYISPNCLFFCLKGANFDGNAFAEKALELGAYTVVTENIDLAGKTGFYVVDDVLKTLQQLALFHRQQMKIPVLGITGTNGKTTTKELVVAVLETKYKVAYTQGNLNNHIGVPLTILAIPRDTQIAIIEMGANHVGEIEDLCQIALPNLGIITNIGTAHIEGFGSKENIILTKTALYHAVKKQKGTIFANINDAILTKHLQDYEQAIYYGNAQCACNGKVINMTPFLQMQVGDQQFETHLTGEYNLYNILCAVTVGLHFGIELKDACNAIAHYEPQNHRSQIIVQKSNTIIADYYNANPTSMNAALLNLSHLNHPKKVAILGDMLELGNVSQEEHRKVVDFCQKNGIESYFVGRNFGQFSSSLHHFYDNTDELNQYLKNHPITDAMILLKGSRGIHLEKTEIL